MGFHKSAGVCKSLQVSGFLQLPPTKSCFSGSLSRSSDM